MQPVTEWVPEVTVVIPTRDRWPMLRAHALAAALAQEEVDLEIVVVDDGSADETPARLAATHDRRVRTVRHERAQGVARARNAGLAAARAPWVAFLDDDDVWAPRKLRLQLDAAAREGADFVFSGVVHVDDELRVIAAFAPPSPHRLRATLASGTPIHAGASNVVVRRSLLERVGGFDPALPPLEDHECWLRLAEKGTAAATPEVLVGYVQHAAASHVKGAQRLIVAFAAYAAKHPADVAGIRRHEARYLRWSAGQLRRSGRRRAAAMLYFRAAAGLRRPRYALGGAAQLVRERGGRLRARATSLSWLARRRAAPAPHVGPPLPGEQFALAEEPGWLRLYRGAATTS